MRFRRAVQALAGAAVALSVAIPAAFGQAQDPNDPTPARDLFGRVRAADEGAAPRSYGGYARGCIAGAVALPIDGTETPVGPAWEVTRLSRNRNWGHPILVAYIQKFAADMAALGWSSLLVGDMGQPRGGPMRTGHASHQTGLDVDLWYQPGPGRVLSLQERETIGAHSVLRAGQLVVDPTEWTDAHNRLIRQAASYPEVARIFVHPGVKRALCESAAPGDRAWLRKVRPWWGHDDHFHVRLSCPAGLSGCTDQEPPPAGDGCGAELAYWFTPAPWAPAPPPDPNAPPPRPVTLADLPRACTGVLGDAAVIATPPLPRPRPAIN